MYEAYRTRAGRARKDHIHSESILFVRHITNSASASGGTGETCACAHILDSIKWSVRFFPLCIDTGRDVAARVWVGRRRLHAARAYLQRKHIYPVRADLEGVAGCIRATAVLTYFRKAVAV